MTGSSSARAPEAATHGFSAYENPRFFKGFGSPCRAAPLLAQGERFALFNS